jgi:5,10-methylenetetrahydromethanopterin reductase
MADLQLSCAFATSHESPEHICVAEDLGYRRAWLYDTPQQSPDVWLILALAAQRTSRIGLGPGVLVPSLRHPMVNATQTRTLQRMAPGRLAVAFGTGFTGRVAMGSPPLRWEYVAAYIRAYRGLLLGETVDWEGARMCMLPSGLDDAQPPDLPPTLLASMGPVGARYAEQLGIDGIVAFGHPPEPFSALSWIAVLSGGTVLDAGEDHTCVRVRETAGPAWAMNYHFPYAVGDTDGIRGLPGGQAFLSVIEKTPPRDRHFAVNQGHLMQMNEADVAAWNAGGHVLLDRLVSVGSAAQIAQALDALAASGVTEFIYQPAGPNIPTELERFRNAAGSQRITASLDHRRQRGNTIGATSLTG